MKPADPTGNRSQRIITRRAALKILGASGVTVLAGLSLPGFAADLLKEDPNTAPAAKPSASLDPLRSPDGRNFNPIDRSVGHRAPTRFSGEDPEKAHRIFWNRDRFTSRIPAPAERTGVVIVGGGLSGLFSGYLLRDQNPVILEGQARFGGNSRGESWHGIDYSIGAAYFMEQPEGSPIHKLYTELGIWDIVRVKDSEDPVLFNGRKFHEFWDGETDPKNAAQFIKLKKLFKDTIGGTGPDFPDIPIIDPSKREYMNKLDRISFKTYLEDHVGGKLHPHIETKLSFYFWSTFSCTFEETSAAAGLNAYSSEFGKVYATPGGNAALAERLTRKIVEKVPVGNLRSSCMVFDVNVVKDGVVVAYEDHKGKVRSIHAKSVILACPKFVVARVLRHIEPERTAAINKLRYNAYLIGNVMLNDTLKEDYYDISYLGDGVIDTFNIRRSAERQGITDSVVATYARPDKERLVLTCYRGLPYNGSRDQVFDAGAFAKYHKEFEAQIRGSILPQLGLDPKKVVDIRIARWGHPMPVPAIGMIADGVCDAVRKPFKDRVFFVEQDNWAYAAVETAALEAMEFAPRVQKAIKG